MYIQQTSGCVWIGTTRKVTVQRAAQRAQRASVDDRVNLQLN
jgi:hypothetical protein